MAVRFTQSDPDPALRCNIRRARTVQRRAHDMRAMVVSASLAGTLGMVALVAHQDAQTVADTPTPPVAAAPAPATIGLDLSGLAALPAALQSWWDAVAQSLQVQAQTGFPAPFTRTRSSR